MRDIKQSGRVNKPRSNQEIIAYRKKDFIRSKKIQSFEGYFWSFIGFTKLKI
jgi:hypothetical protein